MIEPFWKQKVQGFDASVPAATASRLELERVDSAPTGNCEFVGGLPYEGALCRFCTLGSVCFFFADSLACASCPSRIEKLRERKQT